MDGKPFVSTFEGTDTSLGEPTAWPTIRADIQSTVGDIYFVPCWTSLGATGFDSSLVDGACESFGLHLEFTKLIKYSFLGYVAKRAC